MTQEEFFILANTAVSSLRKEQEPTTEMVDKQIAKITSPEMLKILEIDELTSEDVTMLKQEVESRVMHLRTLDDAIFYDRARFTPWLVNAKQHNEINFASWNAYRCKYLMAKSGFSNDALGKLDLATDKILDHLGDPRTEAPWRRHGMVVGQVQSGKTANYIGVISKAADAGFGVIIVLAGLQNALRSQTQKRIDSGFIGKSTILSRNFRRQVETDVGHVDRPYSVISLTTLTNDFAKKIASSIRSEPGQNDTTVYVAVIKKNAHILRSLRDWLTGEMLAKPMLLIDDEADNASVNTHEDDQDPATINALIRDLLHKFPRSAYLGY